MIILFLIIILYLIINQSKFIYKFKALILLFNIPIIIINFI